MLCVSSSICFDERQTRRRAARRFGGALRKLVATLAISAVVVSLLAACVPQDPTKATGRVGSDGLQLSLEGVTIRSSSAVAPDGTNAVLELIQQPVAAELATVVSALSEPISLTLDGGLQPSSPIDLRFEFDESALSHEEWATDDTILVVTQSDDGAVGLLPTTREGNVVTATTDHLSWFQPIQLNLGAAIGQARKFVLEALGLELPAPDCVGKTAMSSTGAEYSIAQGGAVYSCIKATGEKITVNLYAATSMPYRVKSWPAVVGGTVPGTDSSSIFTTLANKYVPSASGGVLMGSGASAQFEFSAAKPPQFFEARQDAHMLVGAVLLNLLGIVMKPLSGGAALMEKIGQLDCLSGVITTGSSDTFDASTAAGLFRTFLACVNTLGPAISLPAAIVLTLIGTVPALFAGAAIGLVNEVTNKAVQRIEVTSSVTPWTVTANGVGPLKVGQTTWGEVSRLPGFSGDADRWVYGCTAGGWFDSGTIYDGVSVLTADQSLPSPDTSVLDVVTVGTYSRTGAAAAVPTATPEGIKLGSTEAQVRAAYPQAKVTTHRLSEALRLYAMENGSGRALVVGVEDGEVVSLTAGNVPEAYAPEGCA